MHTKKDYTVKEVAVWKRFETLLFFIIIVFLVSIYYYLNLNSLKIPCTPLALIAIGVFSIVGYHNNDIYGRIWKARKTWEGIMTTSKTLGAFSQTMITNHNAIVSTDKETIQKEKKPLQYRHILWMTALRFSIRVPKQWETSLNYKANTEWDTKTPKQNSTLDKDIKEYMSKKGSDYIMSKIHKQNRLIYLQSHHLKKLKEAGFICKFLKLGNLIQKLFILQANSERIKNFPYPRKFTTLNHIFMCIFVLSLPLALIPQFSKIGSEMNNGIGELYVWFSIPLYVIVPWIFHTMERIGRTGENHFDGTANGVPINKISRGLKINLRQNLDELNIDITRQFKAKLNTQF